MNAGSGVLSTMKRKEKMSDVEKNFVAYCNSRTNKDKEDDPRKSFLITLLPDLCAMTNQEMRQFKRRVMALIGDILDNRPTSALSVQTASQLCHSIIPLCSLLDNQPQSSNQCFNIDAQNPNPTTSFNASQWWHM
jgi:hypothetical protein